MNSAKAPVRRRSAVTPEQWQKVRKDAAAEAAVAPTPVPPVVEKATEAAVSKPFGGFDNFAACVTKMQGEGHDLKSAQKICGKMQADAEKSATTEVDKATVATSLAGGALNTAQGTGSPPQKLPGHPLLPTEITTTRKSMDLALADILGEDDDEDVRTDGNMDFKEGEAGVGILQTHEEWLNKDQATLQEDFGWGKALRLTPEEITRLSDLSGIDLAPVYLGMLPEGAGYEPLGIDDFRRALNAVYKLAVKLTPEDRALLAKARPISIHTDLRMVRSGDGYWEGGELRTPGNQYADNEILDAEQGDAERVSLNMCYMGESTSKSYGDSEIIRGPLGWMQVGLEKAEVMLEYPDDADGPSSRYRVRAAFRWTAGKQTKTYKEFQFSGGLTGLWVIRYDECGWTWNMYKPSNQIAKSEPLKLAMEAAAKSTIKAKCEIVSKSLDEERLVTGIVLKPEEVDAQGDIYSAKVIRDAATNFLADYNKETELGVQHKAFNQDIQLADSWVAPADFTMGERTIKAGTWLMTVKVLSDILWGAVKDGKITGFSIGGIAKVQPIAA